MVRIILEFLSCRLPERAITGNAAHVLWSNGVRTLAEQFERQALVNTAMFEILVARLGLTKQDVAMKVAEMDLRDEIADGKLDALRMYAGLCGKCGRAVSRRYAKCLYRETGIALA